MDRRKPVPYTTHEVTYIVDQYSKRQFFKIIAYECNQMFHGGKKVRTLKSITYVMARIHANDGWREKLKMG